MQALITRIHRKVPDVHVEGCGRLPDYKEPKARPTGCGQPTGMTHAESARVDGLEENMMTVTADAADLKDQSTRMEGRMDGVDHSLSAIQKHRKQGHDILEGIASKMYNKKTFDK